MSERTYLLEPRDLLFLRDARPMEASDAGLGANWPRPDQLWNALLNAFHRAWPERQPWEGLAHTKHADDKEESSDRFGALKCCGPFPWDSRTDTLFLPYPADADMRVVPCAGTNLPAPLTHAFQARSVGKRSLPAWMAFADYQRYLRGETVEVKTPELFDVERNIGVALDPLTRAAAEHRLYQAEYLRLRPGVSLAFSASCDLRPKGGSGTVDAFDKLGVPADLLIGGQQGVARMRAGQSQISNLKSQISNLKSSLLLRWTLLSPALFPALPANTAKGVSPHPGGWLPTWVDPESGRVMLPRATVKREPGQTRDAWRQRVSLVPKFAARLIAARVGKPLAFSGWDLQSGGPKPTQLAVPAGSAYVFACDNPAEAADLARALSWPNRRSALFGEKGFGLGVCSPISNLKSEISNS